MSWIGVVDCNNFFVSCERLFRPDLVGKPVAVLSSNDGCIVARSQEVKDMGIPMGVPYFKVKDIIKDNKVTLFSSHFTLYRDLSRRVFATLEELLEEVEQYSIDEAFFTIGANEDPVAIAKQIKRELETKIGIPVSIGISSSKTKAKYAVDLAKRTDGVMVLTQQDWEAKMTDIPLSALWGIGRRLSVRYEEAGYRTVADVLEADASRIKALFGIGGERLLAELSNRPAYHVSSKAGDQKSMMNSRSFQETTTELATMEDAIAYHTRQIAVALRQKKLLAKVVRISIQASKYSDFLLQGASLEAVLDTPSNDTFRLLKVTEELLRKAYKPQVPYKKVGVSVSQLVPLTHHQESLFEPKEPTKNPLLTIIDAVNAKADKELITVGDHKRGSRWQSKKELVSPSYTTKWTEVAVVKT